MSKRPELSKSDVIETIPLACCYELAAVELLERMRWGDSPACVHCGSANVYKMLDAATGKRNRRFLWRCHDCKKQYTVRIGTVYEESRLDLRHWCYAFWRAATSKKGVAALEIKRHCQISYKSALFLMSRIRFSMAPDPDAEKLIYESVGPVKQEKTNESPLAWGGAVKGARRAFISTLDRPSPCPTIERGTKRKEVQLSFVP